MNESPQPRRRSGTVVPTIIAVLLIVVGAAILLVLTGIIAEPETVLENIVRWWAERWPRT